MNNYYKKGIEPIDYIMKNNLNFNEGNVIKYISRYKYKHANNKHLQIEDLNKAKKYIDYIIKSILEK